MPNLFVYGTLMYRDVFRRVVRGRYRQSIAVLDGYRRKSIRGEDYPGIVNDPDGTVEGIVWFEVSASDILRLDEFEADEYQRVPAIVRDRSGQTVRVEVYRIRETHVHILEDVDWNREEFEHHGKARFQKVNFSFDRQGR
jgi:gamma-glutamylcyclotransferase (GGCT)/AIG2-like uncharacterized protein YtfP